MCTAATYKTKDFYMGRTLDYEFSYGEQIICPSTMMVSSINSSTGGGGMNSGE